MRTVEQLKEAAKTYWRRLSAELSERYISGIQWRMERVIEASGCNIVETK